MGKSNLDVLQVNQLVGVAVGTIPSSTGTWYYVHSGTGNNGNDGLTPESALAGIDAAINKTAANKGDVIVVMPGHAETVSAASGITADVAGVYIIGLGEGTDKPEITFGTSTSASMVISGASTTVKNIIGIAGIDGLTKPFDVTGDNCVLDIEWRDASSTVEAETAVRLDTANNAKLKLVYKGFTAGNATVRAVAIDDCDNVEIYMDAYGVVSTAWVNMVDVASTNVTVRGRMYTQGITNFTRDVVDTVTGSTWDADIFDASAGAQVSGGSAAALAIDDVAAVAATATIIQDALYGAGGIVTYPAGTAATNNVSIAEVLRYAQENIITGTGTALPSNTSLYGVLAGATGIPTFPQAGQANNDVSMAEVLRHNQNMGAIESLERRADNYITVTADMTSATWNTQASHEVFTVTGLVRMRVLIQCTGTLTDAADGASIQFGVEGSTNAWIASTQAAGAGGNTIEIGELWFDTTPADTSGNTGTAVLDKILGGGLDVGYEITGAALTGGTLVFHCWYVAIDGTGAVSAGAGGAL